MNAGQTTATRGSMARSRRLGFARSHSFAPQAAAPCGTIARMMTRTLAAATLAAVTLGGVGFAASEAKAPAAKCKVVSEQTETRAVVRPSPGIYSGPYDQAGTQSRTATTSRCRGKLVTTYTAWH